MFDPISMLVYVAASLVIGELLRPNPPTPRDPERSALGDFQLPTAEYGRPVPVVYGECHIQGPNVTWWGDLGTKPIKESRTTRSLFRKKTTTTTIGYRYLMGMHAVLCHGMSPAEVARGSGIVQLRFGGKVPSQTHTKIGTDPAAVFTRVTLNSPDLFGGDRKEGGVSGTVDCYHGQYGQPVNDYLSAQTGLNTSSAAYMGAGNAVLDNGVQREASGATVQVNTSAYRGYCHLVCRKIYWSTSKYIKPLSAIVRRYPWFWDETYRANINGNANPAAIIVDMLVNTTYGLGLPMSSVGESFREAAWKLHEEGLGLSLQYDTQQPAKDLITSVLRHVDGVVYTDPTTGRLEMALARDDYDRDALPAFGPDSIVELSMTRQSWDDTCNVVKVKFTDRAAEFKPGVVEHVSQANISVRGVRDEQTIELNGISDTATANMVAHRILRTVSHPLARVTMTTTRDAYSLRPGSVFVLDWPPLEISGMLMRVVRISYGDLTQPEITIDAVEDIFGVTETAFSAPPASTWEDPRVPVVAAIAERLVEAPYHLTGEETTRYAMTYATRQDSITESYQVWSTRGGDWTQTSDAAAFTPSGVLAADYGLTGAEDAPGFVVAQVQDADLLQSVTTAQRDAGEQLLQIDDELMAWSSVTVQEDGSLRIAGVVRGVLDTLPAVHAAGARVHFISAGLGIVEPDGYPSDQLVEARLLPYTGWDSLPISSATTLTLQLSSRALKPYPVGRLRVAGAVAPTRTVGDVTCSWAHRPKRQLLIDERVVSQDYDGYTAPDEGTTYTVQVLVGGVARRTYTGLLDTAVAYTPAQRIADSTDGSQAVQFAVTSVDGAHRSVTRTTEPVLMTGLGMCLGMALGGEQS